MLENTAIKTFHLPGLNGIRAIAALIVIISHINQFSDMLGLHHLAWLNNGIAGYGVVLFFVLSGYLITYLLLLEKDKYNDIDLLNFYKRRILRIWPIYYLIIIITIILVLFGVIVAIDKDLVSITLFYSLFMPNVGYGLGLGLITITPLWSVGVEEQFYAFWPLFLRKVKSVLLFLFSVMFVFLLVKFCFRFFENGIVYKIIRMTDFSCMAIGGLGAYIVHHKLKVLNIIYHPIIQFIMWGLFTYSIFVKPLYLFEVINHELNSFIYIMIIINVSSNKKTIISLENKLLNFLGRISYGLYVYHMLVIFLIHKFFQNLSINISQSIFTYIAVYSIVLILTVTLANFSYKYFESYFLGLKTKFSKIKTTA